MDKSRKPFGDLNAIDFLEKLANINYEIAEDLTKEKLKGTVKKKHFPHEKIG